MRRQRRPKKVDDPLLRDCTACGARAGEGCHALGKDGVRLTLIPRATRLVHADRIETPLGGSNA